MRPIKTTIFENAGGVGVTISLLKPSASAQNLDWLGDWRALRHNTKVAITAVNTGAGLAFLGVRADAVAYEADPANVPITQFAPGGTQSPVAGGISTDGITVRAESATETDGDLILYLEPGARVVITPAVSW